MEKLVRKKKNKPVLSPEVVSGQYALPSTTERHCTSIFLIKIEKSKDKKIVREEERRKKTNYQLRQ